MAFFTPPTLAVGWSISRVDIDVDALTKVVSELGLGPYPAISVSGRFPPQNEMHGVSADWNTKPIAGRKPHASYSSDQFETFSCSLRFYAESIDQEIEPDINQIRAWATKDPELGRPPIVMFQCGDYTFTGAITGFNLRIGERWWTKQLRDASLDLTFEERIWPPLDDVMTRDPSKPPHLSRYVIVKQGDTYESIAKAEYGDPMLGVFLRQDHVVAYPEAGDIVFCPSKSYFRTRLLMPDSPVLSEAEDNVAAIQDLLADLEGEVYEPIA